MIFTQPKHTGMPKPASKPKHTSKPKTIGMPKHTGALDVHWVNVAAVYSAADFKATVNKEGVKPYCCSAPISEFEYMRRNYISFYIRLHPLYFNNLT